MRKRLYVGRTYSGVMKTFRSEITPTFASHGMQYKYVIGPFKTKRGAEYMAKYGAHDNPHLQTVEDAERLAKKEIET